MHIEEVKNNQFYQFPQWLLKEPYNVLSDKAKLIYMLLFDRRTLSVENKWFDDDGKVYMYFTNEQFMELLKCSEKTIIKSKKELSNFGLLNEVRQGINKPNRLYINGTVKVTGQDLNNLQGINTNNINTNISILNNQNLVPSNQTTTNYIYSIAEQEFGRLLSPMEIETIRTMIKENNHDLIKEAIKRTKLQGKTNLNYVRGILRNWRDDNITTIEQIEAKEKSRKSKQEEVSEYDTW
ncbi:TPA: replication initiator protein A [Streptococcus agalactiae]|uniref:DnaD domain protein n=1 Tax=Streptococcus TaxID=1301 RepID=UPI0004042333|nr:MULTISPECIES: DnaD domain protein [Streptococcus]KLJ84270.1 replication protein [Streptococcus agalactiae]OCM62951.1 replication protein [Streptococcus agalactiae]OHO83822.1 replication protein [Streptococcus sp. HMSC056B03]WEZ93144.1 DnaD domain protein [Streptococcus agalactiae]HEN0852152.1 replication initiator protein A [Streptococcus agalactiae]